jgi:hypothetical protein
VCNEGVSRAGREDGAGDGLARRASDAGCLHVQGPTVACPALHLHVPADPGIPEGRCGMVAVIGVDPHKHVQSAVALDERGAVLGHRRDATAHHAAGAAGRAEGHGAAGGRGPAMDDAPRPGRPAVRRRRALRGVVPGRGALQCMTKLGKTHTRAVRAAASHARRGRAARRHPIAEGRGRRERRRGRLLSELGNSWSAQAYFGRSEGESGDCRRACQSQPRRGQPGGGA